MTGGSSYIITLPKEWVKKTNIKKNDPIGLFQQTDGTLLITSKMNRESDKRTKEFYEKDLFDETFLYRRLIAAYIAGFNRIKVKSKGRIPPKTRNIIRKFTHNTIGQEVVEETDNSITVKDLLNPAEMPFQRTIKRMYIMVKGMYEDSIDALKKQDKDITKDIIQRDDEVDRLHWLVARQHNIVTRNVNFAEKMGITVDDAITSFLISRRIERIGDHIVKIAENIFELIDKKYDKKIEPKIEKATSFSIKLLNQSIASFTKKDIEEANDNIENLKKLDGLCEDVKKMALKEEPLIAIHIGYIAESIGRIGEYAEDISEHVINHFIAEDEKKPSEN